MNPDHGETSMSSSSEAQAAAIPADLATDPSASSGTTQPAPNQGLLHLIWEAVRGSRVDFTKESLGRSVLLLAIPMVIEMFAESLFSVVDAFWVGKLGPTAQATVALTESWLVLIYALCIGLSIGATAVVARRTGEKRPEAAARAAVQAIWMGLAFSVVVAGLGIALAPQLLAWMDASPAVVATGTGYTRVLLGGSVTVVLLFMLNAVFRGAGDAAITMRTLWLANIINIVLCPFFVFGWGPFPELGVMGAAVATTIGRGCGVLFQLYNLFGGKRRLQIRWEHVGIDREALQTIVKIARSGMLQLLIGMTSWMVLMKVVSGFGDQVVAGYGVAFRVVMFALLPSWGMSNAAATLVGQNLGAGRPDRAEQAVWRAAFYNVCFLAAWGLAFVLFAWPIAGIFTDDPVVQMWASRGLRTIAMGFLFYAYGMVVTQAFNGAGDTKTPTWLNFICFWLLEIPLAWFLSHHTGLGPSGIFIAMTVCFCTLAVLSVILFKRGKWQQVRV
jgi:putative MATE family efflux protein